MEHRKAAERLAQQQQQAAHASMEEVARLAGWIGKDFIGGAGECVLIRRYGRGLIPVPRSRHHANCAPLLGVAESPAGILWKPCLRLTGGLMPTDQWEFKKFFRKIEPELQE